MLRELDPPKVCINRGADVRTDIVGSTPDEEIGECWDCSFIGRLTKKGKLRPHLAMGGTLLSTE